MADAVIYARVSTEEQAKYGASIDAQIDRCGLHARTLDIPVSGVFSDQGWSASNIRRPAMEDMLTLIRNGTPYQVGSIIVTDLDRLTRNMADLCTLMDLFRRHNVSLIGVTGKISADTADDEFMLNIQGAMAQRERRKTSERVKSTMTFIRQEQGWCVGPPPYGWSAVPHDGPGRALHPKPQELHTIRSARHLRMNGYSYQRIADELGLGHRRQALRVCESPMREEMKVVPGVGYRFRTASD